MQHRFCHSLVRLTAGLVIGTAFSFPDKAPFYAQALPQTSRPAKPLASKAVSERIAFRLKGRLVTQPVAGGPTRPANAAEKVQWQAAQSPHSRKSPGGKYVVDFVPSEITSDPTPLIRTRVEGKPVVSVKALLTAFNAYEFAAPTFEGWLSDGNHAVFALHNHIAGSDDSHRGVLDVRRGRLIAFNGWLAPGNRMALVPSQEYKASDSQDRTDDETASGDRISVRKGPKFYAVALSGPVAQYRFASAGSRRLLTLEGRPLYLGMQQRVFFSQDGTWAAGKMAWTRNIGAVRTQKWKLRPGETASAGLTQGSFVVSLKTGKARWLPGDDPLFLTTGS